jgi:hypothetical protein
VNHERRLDLFALALVAAVTLVGVAVWPRLPTRLAIHWQGATPDGYAAKPVALFGTTLLGLGAIAAVRLAPAWATSTPGGENLTVLIVGLTISWAQAVIVVWNLGYRFDVTLAVLPLFAAVGLLVVVGNRLA